MLLPLLWPLLPLERCDQERSEETMSKPVKWFWGLSIEAKCLIYNIMAYGLTLFTILKWYV